MASHTQIAKAKRRNKLKKSGRKRKRKMAQKSTLSAVELFEGFGEPQPSTK